MSRVTTNPRRYCAKSTVASTVSSWRKPQPLFDCAIIGSFSTREVAGDQPSMPCTLALNSIIAAPRANQRAIDAGRLSTFCFGVQPPEPGS